MCQEPGVCHFNLLNLQKKKKLQYKLHLKVVSLYVWAVYPNIVSLSQTDLHLERYPVHPTESISDSKKKKKKNTQIHLFFSRSPVVMTTPHWSGQRKK